MTSQPLTSAEHLPAHECWRMARTTTLARLAVSIDGRPDIFPINYAVDHGSIVFRTATGTKLAAALDSEAVAVEMDGMNEGGTHAWSVVLKGRAGEVTGLHPLLEVDDLAIHPWHESPKNRFVRIEPTEITGRRFEIAHTQQRIDR